MSLAVIRRAELRDAPALAALCAEHARFEGGSIANELATKLSNTLLSARPMALAWVAVDELSTAYWGYATADRAYSTWHGAQYLHLDCLYLAEQARGKGIGRIMLDAIRAYAFDEGFERLEWQTPPWNEGATRFYRRFGATSLPKLRFSMQSRVGAKSA